MFMTYGIAFMNINLFMVFIATKLIFKFDRCDGYIGKFYLGSQQKRAVNFQSQRSDIL